METIGSSSKSVIGWIVALSIVMTFTLSMPTDKYMQEREKMLKADISTRIGQGLKLRPDEILVSDFLVKEKAKLMENSRLGGQEYFPSLSFYRSKPLIEKTTIYKLIQQMPKGAALHLHDMSITSIDWLVKNVTYRDNLYMCDNTNTTLKQFMFSKNPPKNYSDCVWYSVKEARKSAINIDAFDENIKRNISMLSSDPLVTYPTIDKVWSRFMGYFGQIHGMVMYAPVFRDYFKQALKEFAADNVQYIELRGLFDAGIFELDGTRHDADYCIQQYNEVTKEFVKENPDFSGAKLIWSAIRNKPQDVLMENLKNSMKLRQKYPEFLLGFDLVGQEDPNYSLLYYRKELLYPSQLTPPQKLPYFFHAAETNWQGTAVDYNLLDAILLNTTRIGHGYGLVKHPSLVKLVKEKGIAVEVNPISNQLLGLLKDFRNHAMVPLMANDLPLVISSDDPTTWEAAPLSHDFYMAFMNMCGEDADLRFLKQLAINSIQYSAMKKAEKQAAMKLWAQKWDKFITKTAKSIMQGGFYKI